jgi:hypothetical protein
MSKWRWRGTIERFETLVSRADTGSIRQDREVAVMATEINQPAGYAPDSYESGRTGWTGWIAFAGVMMIIGGGLNALYRTRRHRQ